MKNFKSDFPIFSQNPWLVYLDSWATSQKPKNVIDWVKDYLEKNNSNIHRWSYQISQNSEDLYDQSKIEIAKLIGCKPSEIIYTYNSTYGFNILSTSLLFSSFFKPWDNILISMAEHHANVVPRMVLKNFGVEVRFFWVDENFDIDYEDFEKKYDKNTKVVSVTQVSNVTWKIFELKKLKSLLREETLFFVDWSQSAPHIKVDFQELDADAFVFTWHKIFALTGIWVLVMKKSLMNRLNPWIVWGWAIQHVATDNVTYLSGSHKFEAWTPNVVGAVSMLEACKYIESIGGIETIENYEKPLIEFCLKKFFELEKYWVKLLGSKTNENRIWTFSFSTPKWVNALWDFLAQKNVCIRAGLHCAHPLHTSLDFSWTARISLSIYNDIQDLEMFFEQLEKFLK